MYHNQRVSTSSYSYHAITRYSKPGIDYSTNSTNSNCSTKKFRHIEEEQKNKNLSGSFVDILDFCGVA